MPNWIELAGVVNMRDLGGLRTDAGDVVAPHRMLRSDNLQDLPPESVRELVQRFGLTDVVDLRSDVEVAKEGDGPLRAVAEVHHHHFTLYRENSSESGIPAAEQALPWEVEQRTDRPATTNADSAENSDTADTAENDGGAGPRGHDEFWSAHYLSYLEQRPDSVVAALQAIAHGEGAVVVHCAAGKDRTGTVVGLALKTVGVVDDEIIADFAASAERVPRILERLRDRPATPPTCATRPWRSSPRRPTRCVCCSMPSSSSTVAPRVGWPTTTGRGATPNACVASCSPPERGSDRSVRQRSVRPSVAYH